MFLLRDRLITQGEKRGTSTKNLKRNNVARQVESFCIPYFAASTQHSIKTVGDVVAQWLVRRTWDQKVESSSPGRCTHVVFSGKTLSQCLSPPKCINDNLTKCWDVTCNGLVSHLVEILLVASFYRNRR